MSSDAEHTNHERLMDAAVEVVAERGYDGAGVAEIARRAGLTTGAIYSRFTGKADLLAEAVDARVPEALRDVLAGAGDEPAANLLARLGDRLVSVQDTPGDALLIEAIVASRRDDVLADRLRARFEEQRAGVAKLVEEGKADGTIDSALDTDAVVKFAHALGLGFLLHRILDTPLPEQRHWQAVIERLLVAASPTPSSEDRP